jgi:hypothetical protein
VKRVFNFAPLADAKPGLNYQKEIFSDKVYLGIFYDINGGTEETVEATDGDDQSARQ